MRKVGEWVNRDVSEYNHQHLEAGTNRKKNVASNNESMGVRNVCFSLVKDSFCEM